MSGEREAGQDPVSAVQVDNISDRDPVLKDSACVSQFHHELLESTHNPFKPLVSNWYQLAPLQPGTAEE